ncbi:MAG: hypothetical protein ABIA93_02535 [Candidatus Woesearchaeota archaeon]
MADLFVSALGIMDVLSGLGAVLIGLDIFGLRAGVGIAMYLVLKAIVFRFEILSTIDALAGLVVLIGSLLPLGIVFWVGAGYLIGKGAYSLL